MRITAVQTNPTIGDIMGIRQSMIHQTIQAAKQGSHIIMFPELATTGYPPLDLLHREDFIQANIDTIGQVTAVTADHDIVAVFGCISRNSSNIGNPIYNSVVAARNGRLIARHNKTLLPTYDVFDEDRYFEQGSFDTDNFHIFEVNGIPVGLLVCEEVWNPLLPRDQRVLYGENPVKRYADRGSKILLVVNASPFRVGVGDERRDLIRHHCKEHHQTMVYLNQAGLNDRLVFDGNSFAMNPSGKVIAWSAAFDEAVMIVNTESAIELDDGYIDMPRPAAVRAAEKLAAFDYMTKQNITGPAFVGMSGGIDSALVADYLIDALGADRVVGFALPSEFNDADDEGDAQLQARKAGIAFDVIPISFIHETLRKTMDESFARLLHAKAYKLHAGEAAAKEPLMTLSDNLRFKNSGVPDENIQARIRGLLLMAWANWRGGMVFSTGNKSEMAVGYCTLYGDMCGGFAQICDLPKTMVWEQAKFANESRNAEWIPVNAITKPPSAKLRANQVDQDSLPPYQILDEVMRRYADENEAPKRIIQAMQPQWGPLYPTRSLRDDIIKVCYLIDRSEFKRRQAPLGPKISSRDLRSGRRYPVVQDFTEYWKTEVLE